MIDKVLNVIGLFKELPEAIGYSIFGPLAFSLPKELQEAIGQSASKKIETVNVVYLKVDNFTNKEIRELSIMYGGSFSYTPNLNYERREIKPDHQQQEDKKVFLIKNIPPKDSVKIEIFLDQNETISIDNVLADGVLVTKWMQKIADIHRYPRFAIMYLAMLVMLGFTGWTAYSNWTTTENYKIVNESMSDWEGCSPYPFENNIESEKLLKREFLQQQNYHWLIFKLNKVNSFEELKLKDTVILCKPTSPKN
ncbi:MAG: hypothetical protein AMJ53_18295 [Gammaproteobacteria bacterium SG8_11]|nr:MAG: hypothetical protein AMJ53_18295 [Gammaproteobacteria bacterium SG8_11]